MNLDFGASAFNGSARWLDITVQSGTNAAETLTPRVQVLPTPYAQFAAVAATVTNGAIMNAQLAGNAVNTTNIQNGSVTDAKIVSVSGTKVTGFVSNSIYATAAYGATVAATLINGSWSASVGNYNGYNNIFGIYDNNSLVFGMAADGVLSTGGISALNMSASNLYATNSLYFLTSGPNSAIKFKSGVHIVDNADTSLTIYGNNGGIILNGGSIISADNSASLYFGTGALNVNGGMNEFGTLTVGTSSSTALSISTDGTVITSGPMFAQSFNPVSDRNLKDNFTPVSANDILEKVASLPITKWNFKTDGQTRHIGPMAQDFYAAFNVGTDDKHIATVDEDGVALAAIQGLNEKLKEKDAQIEALNKRLADLEQLVKTSVQK